MSDTATIPPATSAAPVTPKETKAQRAERLKLAKNPWETWNEIKEYARQGRDSLPAEWAEFYLKWWGVYTQGDGVGVTGGKDGHGKATEYFMMRIALPNGLLTSHQLRTIGQLTQKYANNLADITTRQNIQLHWLTLQGLVEVVDAVAAVGLFSKGACGDVMRNVTGCPLAGLLPHGPAGHELIDGSPLAQQLARGLTGNPEFVNLPRKFKVTVSGCPLWCSYPEINDVALTAIKREVNGLEEVGYTLRVGGGLSTEPHIAVRIPAFIPQDKAYAVVEAVLRIFKDSAELRENRTRARIKYLFMRHGWTAETMLEAVEAKLGYKLDPSPLAEDIVPDDIYRDHVGITPQKQPGLSAVGASVLGGRLSGDQLVQLADLSEQYGDGQLRATIMQNIVLVNVPNDRARELVHKLGEMDLRVESTPFFRGAITCTGTEFCKLAIAETKAFSKWLTAEMEDRLPGFDQQIKLHVTGCTNSCGQSWIADIGLEGKKIKKDGKMVDAFYFCVGGAVGKYAAIARQVGYRAAAEDCPEAIERLLRAYLAARSPGEDLRAYFARHDDDSIRAQLNGTWLPPVERDAPPAAGRFAPAE
ncbi:MAG TPA: nitrite reductase [Acidobacteriaceae bacterium]